MSRDQWLAERRTGIGGSDVAAILGLNPWASPYTVWADKLELLPEREDNEAMRQGRDFEPYVAARFCEVTGKKVRRVNRILRHPVHTFMLANIDRFIVGESAGLECKTTSTLNTKRFKDGDFPAEYYAQAVHYMAVTGARRWFVAVLILNQRFLIYQLTRNENDTVPVWCESSVHIDDTEIESLITAEREFWALVESNIPPTIDGAPPTTDALETIYADSNGEGIDLFGREGVMRDYLMLRAEVKDTERRMEELKQQLMQDLGCSERGACGAYSVTWKPQTRRTFDYKRFFEDNPDISSIGYWKESTFRKFDVKGDK
jgi:putative phage-type endonuclease